MKKVFYIHDDQYIKWMHDGMHYCVHIRQDDAEDSPRKWYNVGTMACWHGRYNLGDEIGNVEPEEYWQDLVRKLMSEEEIFNALVEGKCHGIEVEHNAENPAFYDVYETWIPCFGGCEPVRDLEYEQASKSQVVYWVLDDLTMKYCQILLEPYIEWIPLYHYDHGGITISTGGFSCPWDSGQVGFIWISKEKTISESLGKTFEDGTYITANEENWREVAIYHLEAETEVYDQYLRGEVYGYHLYEIVGHQVYEEDIDNEIDNCWGFYGDNLYTNGIMESCPGLEEALESGDYQEGDAHKHTVSYYVYD